jgi:putative resolvase
MVELLTIKETADYLNVSQDTLRKWDRSGKLKPLKTAGGHRRYDISSLNEFIGLEKKQEVSGKTEVCATYARVSSHEQKQKGDLDRQSQRLSEYCAKKNLMVSYIIKDVGSGLNDNRSGFIRLTDLIIQGKVNKLVIENKDRLTRFQFNFIKKMFESYGCKVIVINETEINNEELATDIMSLIASFSGKFYGRRSAERRKKNKNIE